MEGERSCGENLKKEKARKKAEILVTFLATFFATFSYTILSSCDFLRLVLITLFSFLPLL